MYDKVVYYNFDLEVTVYILCLLERAKISPTFLLSQINNSNSKDNKQIIKIIYTFVVNVLKANLEGVFSMPLTLIFLI